MYFSIEHARAFRYETENGIFAQEKAVVGMKHSAEAGTRGEGFYQYIGDDDRIYRVEYTVGENGFQPKVKNVLQTKNAHSKSLTKYDFFISDLHHG